MQAQLHASMQAYGATNLLPIHIGPPPLRVAPIFSTLACGMQCMVFFGPPVPGSGPLRVSMVGFPSGAPEALTRLGGRPEDQY